MGSAWLFVFMALGLMATAVYSVQNRRKVSEEFALEMKDIIQEALLAKKDLEAVVENTLLLSDGMIENLDQRLRIMENTQFPAENPARSAEDRRQEQQARPRLPYKIEDLRRAHPSIVVPRLFNEGYGIPEIAELLNRGQGEIRLILDIQKRREVGG